MTIGTAFNITKTAKSRINQVDLDNPGFGRVFTDHMLEIEYREGAWQQPQIKPYGKIEVEPSLNTFHYGQAVFEGTKAYFVNEKTINLFRLEKNYERMVQSCRRMCIPVMDEEMFVEGISELVRLDHKWVPRKEGNTLYIRPFAFAFDPVITARASETYRFYVIMSPAGAYYSKPVSLVTSQKYVRAAEGGVGEAKTAGNYAASFYPTQKAKEKGFDQVLWLDANEHKYVEEVGTMNIFFVIDGVLVTPELHGTILSGVTRNSIIQLAGYLDIPCEERRLEIDEVIEAGEQGRLDEVFGAGTAAVISPVKEVSHNGKSVHLDESGRGPIGRKLYETITGIQCGKIDDPFGWTRQISIES